jgi:hypothetical protein
MSISGKSSDQLLHELYCTHLLLYKCPEVKSKDFKSQEKRVEGIGRKKERKKEPEQTAG